MLLAPMGERDCLPEQGRDLAKSSKLTRAGEWQGTPAVTTKSFTDR